MRKDKQSVIGRIAFTKKRGPHGKGHYMETSDRGYCSRDITPGRIMPEDWNPEEHPEVMCSKCLEWWRILHKPKPAGKVDEGAGEKGEAAKV